jgi:hypothetical protein
MSDKEKTYTIQQLKIMNSGFKWNNRILIPENANEKIRWKIKFTWEDSGSLDGKYYNIIPAYWSKKN